MQSTEEDLDGQGISIISTTIPRVYSYKELNETHTAADVVQLERVRKLIFEIKKSPKYGGDIMRGFVARNSKITRKQSLDQEDSKCLISMSNLFYDNIYLEEHKGPPMM